ncbi:MAG: hypothetical protein Q9N34_04080 [Aquificota bacterium]|nr:hypothetical protein [Aquificota bacterium]
MAVPLPALEVANPEKVIATITDPEAEFNARDKDREGQGCTSLFAEEMEEP